MITQHSLSHSIFTHRKFSLYLNQTLITHIWDASCHDKSLNIFSFYTWSLPKIKKMNGKEWKRNCKSHLKFHEPCWRWVFFLDEMRKQLKVICFMNNWLISKINEKVKKWIIRLVLYINRKYKTVSDSEHKAPRWLKMIDDGLIGGCW